MTYQIGLLDSAWTQDGLRRFRWNPQLAEHDDELAVGDVVEVSTNNGANPNDDLEITKIDGDYVYGRLLFTGTVDEFKRQLDGDTLDSDLVEPAVRESLVDQGYNSQEIDQIIDALTVEESAGEVFKGLREAIAEKNAKLDARIEAIIPVITSLADGEMSKDEASDRIWDLDVTLSELQIALDEAGLDDTPTDGELLEMMRVHGRRETAGEQLRRLRARAGLSQNDVADKAGIAQGRLSEYEQGMRSPSAEMLERLAHVLGPIVIR